MNLGWLESLKMRQQAQAKKPACLEDQIKQWWRSELIKQESYHMSYFMRIFPNLPSRIIGTALFQLGWERKRRYGKGPEIRYWVPPT